MSAHTKRRQVLLSTATLVGALSGYGRSADAACVAGVPPAFECSGANATQQTIALNNATVTTVPYFYVNTGSNNGVRITGDGALSYTDANASAITAGNTALRILSTGDDGATPGSVTVNTNGDVTGTDNRDIDARSGNISANLSVTTGTGTTVTGGSIGIRARNRGSGDIDIIANGDVTGDTDEGINAQNTARAFSGLTDLLGGFPKFRESDSMVRLAKEASLYDPTSFD